jgi:hypothetical protein
MIEDISQAIEGLVGQLDNTFEGIFNTSLDVIEVCNTKWARAGKMIQFGNDEFLIQTIQYDQFFTTGDAQTGMFTIAQPYFVPGTPISANREWTIADNNLMDKTPLVWLLHDIRYRKFGRESVFEWEADLRLFFLDETNTAQFYTRDHIQNVVVPMSKLAEEFIKVVNANRSYLTLDQWEVLNFTRFGTEREGGSFSNILDANLSGVELRITLTKYKENCKC